MSEQNLEVARRLNEAFNARSAGWGDFYAPQAEVRMPPQWMEDSVYIGPDGVERLAATLMESFDELRWDTDRLIDAGDCVVGLYHQRGRMKDGGAWIEAPVGLVIHMEDGKVVRAVAYFSWAEALEAAGAQE